MYKLTITYKTGATDSEVFNKFGLYRKIIDMYQYTIDNNMRPGIIKSFTYYQLGT